MAVVGIDLGGTKLAAALFTEEGRILSSKTGQLGNRSGKRVGELIATETAGCIETANKLGHNVSSVGVSVPGISRKASGTVWAPNIPGWEDYPLLKELKDTVNDIPVVIESDRSCYISGEVWQGNAKGCRDAIFLAVGTGIGAGIIANGEVLRGSHDIAGAIGWLALDRPYDERYAPCGNFEYFASGEGITRQARNYLAENKSYNGLLRKIPPGKITTSDVFKAFEEGDVAAEAVIKVAIDFWAMAAANLVSLFNPEKIIFGGGVFGPGVLLLPDIKREAARWAQPISIRQVSFEPSALKGDAGVCGAAYLAMTSSKMMKP